jgi:hypothetical protein
MQGTNEDAVSGGRLARLGGPLGVLAAGAAAFAVVNLVDPNEPGHYPTCPFLALTGDFCPGCGSLRSMHAVTQGDLAGAAGLNVLALASLPVLAVIWLRWTRRTWTGAARPQPVPAAWLWALAILVVAFGLVRNLPFGAALAP